MCNQGVNETTIRAKRKIKTDGELIMRHVKSKENQTKQIVIANETKYNAIKHKVIAKTELETQAGKTNAVIHKTKISGCPSWWYSSRSYFVR